MRKIIVGVMGGGTIDAKVSKNAYELGKRIAEKDWVLLNGGRKAGVMDESARGAKEAGGLTIGILPGKTLEGVSDFIDLPIVTGIGDARNYINVLSCDIVVACPGEAGTVSEIALALKNNKMVILLDFDIQGIFAKYEMKGLICKVATPDEAIRKIETLLRL